MFYNKGMDHVAIMKKSWELTQKILSGEKKIESRWYMNKSAPWGRIKRGDTVYFKNSGEPVFIKTKVSKVLEFESLTPQKVKEIIAKYGVKDGICMEDANKFYKLFKNKKFCLLIFLQNPEKVRPFDINKKGFGLMSAWLCAGRVSKVKIKRGI